MSKKIIVENNTRKVFQFKQALVKQTPYVSSHGMSPAEMKKRLTRKVEAERRIISRRSHHFARPEKVVKTVAAVANPKSLFTAPRLEYSPSVEYPTPPWFRQDDQVDVSVIVPLFKSESVVYDLVQSWPLEDESLKVEIIFVDDQCPNNSKDHALRAWLLRKDQLFGKKIGKIIYNTENKGYGGACNKGAEYAKGKYLIFLNADTTLTPGWLSPLVNLFKNPGVGIVGNLHLKDGGQLHGTIDSAGSEWLWKEMCFVHLGRHCYNRQMLPTPFRLQNTPEDLMQVGEREMVTGCCFAITADLFRYVGGFNSNYRIGYWEDAELCMTVRELGYKILYEPKSIIHHKLSHTNSGSHPYHDQNRNYFMNKWVNSNRLDSLVKDVRLARTEIRTILVKRRGARGDVLVAAAVASGLKKMYPSAKINFITHCQDVLENHPHIDRIVNENAISERQFQVYYDLDMAYEYRPHANILHAFAECVGVKPEDCRSYVHTRPVPGLPDKFIVVHPGETNWVGRNWKSEGFAEVASRMLSQGKKVVCVGEEDSSPIPATVDLRGRTSVSELAYVISKADLFVGIDSFPMHVAQAFHKPGCCFFGSIKPESRIYTKEMKSITASITCLGCHHRKPVPCLFTKVCETGNQDCIHQVTTEVVWSKVQQVLQSSK